MEVPRQAIKEMESCRQCWELSWSALVGSELEWGLVREIDCH